MQKFQEKTEGLYKCTCASKLDSMTYALKFNLLRIDDDLKINPKATKIKI